MVTRNRRPLEWFTHSYAFNDIAAGAQEADDVLVETSGRHLKGHTITRCLVDLWVRPTTIDQFSNTWYGLTLVNVDAAAASAFPDADVDSDNADWILRGMTVNSITGTLTDSSQWSHRRYDLRAQRVIRTDQDQLRMVWDQSSAGGASRAAFFRILLKLP